ncbi:MAG: type VI secretion system tube protein Hcp [Leifsonia sp.]
MTTDLFLAIDGIPGESADAGHRDEIDVLSWGWDESAEAGGGYGGGAGRVGRVSLQDFHFTHHVDRSSPLLLAACATGRHIRKAVLTVRRPGDDPIEYLVVTLEELTVGAVALAGSQEEDRPTESVTLRFARITVEYRPQLPDGSLGAAVVFEADRSRNV